MTNEPGVRVSRSPFGQLATVWLVVAAPVAAAALMLFLLSDRGDGRLPAIGLASLAVSGVAVSARLKRSPRVETVSSSLLVSAAWFVVAVSLYPTQQFALDIAWVVGVPMFASLLTAVVALRARRLAVIRP